MLIKWPLFVVYKKVILSGMKNGDGVGRRKGL
jgi:hypothetical protein